MFRKLCASGLVYKSLLDANRPATYLSSSVLSARLYSTNDQFQQAVQNVSKLKSEPDNEIKLGESFGFSLES